MHVYHTLSAYLSFDVILSYDIKMYHFRDIMYTSNNIVLFPFIFEIIIIFS